MYMLIHANLLYCKPVSAHHKRNTMIQMLWGLMLHTAKKGDFIMSPLPKINMEKSQGVLRYSYVVTGRCNALCWVCNLWSEEFLGVRNFWWHLKDERFLLRTCLRVGKECKPGFSFLFQTYIWMNSIGKCKLCVCANEQETWTRFMRKKSFLSHWTFFGLVLT